MMLMYALASDQTPDASVTKRNLDNGEESELKSANMDIYLPKK